METMHLSPSSPPSKLVALLQESAKSSRSVRALLESSANLLAKWLDLSHLMIVYRLPEDLVPSYASSIPIEQYTLLAILDTLEEHHQLTPGLHKLSIQYHPQVEKFSFLSYCCAQNQHNPQLSFVLLTDSPKRNYQNSCERLSIAWLALYPLLTSSKTAHSVANTYGSLSDGKQSSAQDELSSVGDALEAALNIDELLHVILEQATRLSSAYSSEIALVDEGMSKKRVRLKCKDSFLSQADSYYHYYFPITRHNQLFAHLQLCMSSPPSDPNSFIEQFSRFNQQAAMAIENAQIFELEQQRAREATTLYQAARMVEEAQNLSLMLRQICSILSKISQQKRCLIYLRSPESSLLQLEAQIGLNKKQSQFLKNSPLTVSSLSQTLQEKLTHPRPLVFHDLPEGEPGLSLIHQKLNSNSFLLIPLRSSEKLLGFVYLDSPEKKSNFSSFVLRKLITVALQMGSAIQKAQLFNAMQESLLALTSLYDVSTVVSQSLNLDEVLSHVVCEAQKLVKDTSFALVVLDEFAQGCQLKYSSDLPLPLRNHHSQAIFGQSAVEDKCAYCTYKDQPFSPPVINQKLEKTGLGGVFSIPLILNDKMVGLVNCFLKEGKHLHLKDIRLIKAFTNQVAIAVENARLHGMLHYRMGELSTLYEVSRSITSSLQLDTVLLKINQQIHGILNCDASAVLLVEQDSLVLKNIIGLSESFLQTSLSLNKGIAGEVVRTQTPYLLLDDQEESHHRFPQKLREHHIRSIFFQPIIVRQKTVGVLCNYYKNHIAYSPAQKKLLNTLSSQAAVAIENARLFEDKLLVTKLFQDALNPKKEFFFHSLHIGHRYIPSADLSGDYYDVISLTKDRCAIVIADVAGKGTDAAIQNIRTKHFITAYALAGYPPSKILGLLNNHIYRLRGNELRHVTLFYGVIDLKDSTLTFANAGHEPAIYWNENEPDKLQEIEVPGLVLGAMPDWQYQEETLPFQEGHHIFLYTDGITEARNHQNEFFGSQKIIDTCKRSPKLKCQELVDLLFQKVSNFSPELQDDLSLLCIGR